MIGTFEELRQEILSQDLSYDLPRIEAAYALN